MLLPTSVEFGMKPPVSVAYIAEMLGHDFCIMRPRDQTARLRHHVLNFKG